MRGRWLTLIGVAVASCTPDTAVLVVIDAEGASARRAQVLHVAAYEEGGAQRLDADLGDEDGATLPWRLLLTPRGGDSERRYEIEAALSDGAPFSRVRLVGGFERGAVRQLSVCFRDACDGALCGDGESCVRGACAPVEEAPLSRLDEPACGDAECAGRDNGDPCEGGACHGGACCRGCWDGERCARGDARDACGSGGASCVACEPHQVCAAGACAAATAVESFDVGARHACAVVGGAVFCWGDGASALGDASAGAIRTPRRVALPGTDAWAQVATGDASCARSDRGAIVCWGGRWGAPRAALVLDPPATYVDVAAGVGFVCGVRDDGALVCEGDDAWGQLGAGEEEVPQPVVVQRAFWVGTTGTIEERPDGPQVFADARAGVEGAVARRADGTAFVWGRFARWNGRAYEDWATPGPFFLDDETTWLDVGKTPRHHHCAIDASGALRCGGWSAYGELGRGEPAGWWPLEAGIPGRFRRVAAGAETTCAIAEDGSLHCWGRNDRGQLGGASARASEPAPVRLGDRTDWTEVEAWHGGCALADALYCWGANEDGQTGTGRAEEVVAQPTRVSFEE